MDKPASDRFPIPARLNLAIALAQLLVLCAILWGAGQAGSWWAVALLSLAYGVAMNSGYATLHEAEHGIFHPVRWVNETAGAVLALFFPAPFHLLRQGHIGHHMRNRSDDEAFDYYFEGENAAWKRLQFYGILTGMFWAVIVLGNLLAAVYPAILKQKKLRFDRATLALQESLNPRHDGLIRLEAWCALLLHAALMYFWQIPPARYAAVLFGFGFMWSAMQYAHHFGTVRHVRRGTRNLRTFALLDLVWLNHNWHLNHHLRPTIPWIYLPKIFEHRDRSRGSVVAAYLKMWRGPRFTSERVENLYAGRIIR